MDSNKFIGVSGTREEIIALLGKQIMDEGKAVMLESDIYDADPSEPMCLSMLTRVYNRTTGEVGIMHQFEDNFVERCFPVPTYKIVDITDVYGALVSLNARTVQRHSIELNNSLEEEV